MATTFDAIGSDPQALQDTISGGPPALQAGIDTLPAQRPFLAEFSELQRRLQPGVRDLRISLPGPQRRDRGRHAGARPQRRRQPAAPRRLPPARPARPPADDEELAEAPRRHVRQRQAPRQVGRAGADRLQLLELLLDAPARAPDRGGQRRLHPARVADRDAAGDAHVQPRLQHHPRPRRSRTAAGAARRRRPRSPSRARWRPASRPPATRACRPTASPPAGEFEPHELPILHANPAAPMGQNGSDCQPGQTGYTQGQLLAPGQPKSNPAFVVSDIPGDRGLTTSTGTGTAPASCATPESRRGSHEEPGAASACRTGRSG